MSDRSTDLIRTVAELFPVFVADSWRTQKPLAIGVDKQLVEAGVLKPEEAAAVLRMYCRRRTYLVAVAAGGYRYNLDGSIAGEISPEHVAAAKGSLTGLDRRAAKATEAAKAARQAERAQRDVEKAKAAAEWFAARRAERKAAERQKSPAPYHRATPQKIAPRPAQPVGDGLAALREAARLRKQQEAAP